MSRFPKAPRFSPEKPSEVPGPGLYNPKLHDPLDDPWRKGLLGIYKAPRCKDVDPGPDTFGLYNPDQSSHHQTAKTRARAVSTYASLSKHQAELLRLESKLFERDSNISDLTESLKVLEQAAKETRRALQRSEGENRTLQSEVERLREQMHKVAGLQRRVVELQDEHDKSKTRRDNELTRLKSELRHTEDRAARYLSEKDQVQLSLDQLRRNKKDELAVKQSSAKHAYQQSIVLINRLVNQRDDFQRSLDLSSNVSRLHAIHYRKTLANRASQVSEFVTMMNEASAREEYMHDLLDSFLETEDLMSEKMQEDQSFLESIYFSHQSKHDELRSLLYDVQEYFDLVLHDERSKTQLLIQQADTLQLELSGLKSVNTSLCRTICEHSEAYSNLSKVHSEQRRELEAAQAQLKSCECNIEALSATVSSRESEVTRLQDCITALNDDHSLAIESWETQKSNLQSSLKRCELQLMGEREQLSRMRMDLRLAQQAEAALRGEANYAQNLTAQLQEAEKEVERMTKINDLLMRRSNLSAEEADRVAKINADLVSQQNPAQRVRVLERMRREIKEEKENNARLQNELWAAESEVKSLKTELSAYQPLSHPTDRRNLHPTSKLSSLNPCMSRVERLPLKEITPESHNFQEHGRVRSAAIFDNLLPAEDREIKALANPVKPGIGNINPPSGLPQAINRASKVPPKPRAPPALRKIHTLKNDFESATAERSIGAVKMDGEMTLDELR